MSAHPVTPDGRYFVVRGRLWRCANPALDETERARLVGALMAARRAKGQAMRAGDAAARVLAREAVDEAKVALGERGPVWWTDGAPDWNRRLARTTPYADWWTAIEQSGSAVVSHGTLAGSGSPSKGRVPAPPSCD